MCGGMIGELVGGIDKAANSINPMKQPMQWLTDNTVSKVWKPAGQLYDYSNSHPLESLAAMAAAWGGASYLGAGGAGEAAGGAGLGATDVGAGTTTASGFGGVGSDAAATGWLGADGTSADALAAGTTSSGFGGVGTDAGVMASPDGGLALGQQAGSGSWLSQLFGGSGNGGSTASSLLTKKNALGAMQILSGLYGLTQSQKLSKAASAQAQSKAGEQAVMRSMASQGYQGSGNMATALSDYAAGRYTDSIASQQSSLGGSLASLGLLTAGAGSLAGWGG